MTISEIDRLDLMVTVDGCPELVIVDLGNLGPSERNTAFRKKLHAYGTFIATDEFQAKNENWRAVRIKLTSAVAPTKEMQTDSFLPVVLADGTTLNVPVKFETIAPSLGG